MVLRNALIATLAVFVTACAYVPFDAAKDVTRFNSVDGMHVASASGPTSRFYELTEGRDGLGARMQLLDHAKKTIDVSTFLIKTDTAGQLFAAKLLQAADRGVRVRFLIDDVFTTTKDYELALLDQHENIEIRIFNPASRQAPKSLGFLFDFKRVNRRMHNKVFIVDNSWAIVGGRNIANEYYQLDKSAIFADFEVLTAGPDAPVLGNVFDTYWNDKYAVPLDALLTQTARQKAANTEIDWDVDAHPDEVKAYNDAVSSPYLQAIISGQVKPDLGAARIVVDPPDKLRGKLGFGPHDTANTLFTEMKHARREVVMLTPYFVPEPYGVDFYADLVRRGIRVRIVTNSLAATNHPYVHGGYLPYRKALLDAGVELFEIRSDVSHLVDNDGGPVPHLTMHSKVGVIDDDTVFVGSLNFDPRSIRVNTEIGMFIHSASMAKRMLQEINHSIHDYAYKVTLDGNGDLVWTYRGFAQPETVRDEPLATGWEKFQAHFTRLLGVEILL